MAKLIEERLDSGLRYTYKINNFLYSTTTQYQRVDLVDTQPFGKALLIDGLMQSSDIDEFIYHECLVHPAILCHPNPKTVFIAGGGEGSTAREVLRHKTVERLVMCDIDQDVVSFCREHLEQNKEAFADPRLHLIYKDAVAEIETTTEKFDVIIIDVDDPTEEGPCTALYFQEFYETAKSKLNPGGVFVTQSSASGIKHHMMVFTPVNNTLKKVFASVHPYVAHILCFADMWSWQVAFRDADSKVPSVEELNKRISERITGTLGFIDGETIHGTMGLNKMLRTALSKENKVISKANPAYFFSHDSFNDTSDEDESPTDKDKKAKKDKKKEPHA